MYSNAPAWDGIKTHEDIALLSRERQGWLTSAVRAGAYLVANIGAGEQAKDSEYANHSFHAGIIAAARYLIRMVELLPACDVYQVSLDLDKLLLKLPQCKPLRENSREWMDGELTQTLHTPSPVSCAARSSVHVHPASSQQRTSVQTPLPPCRPAPKPAHSSNNGSLASTPCLGRTSLLSRKIRWLVPGPR